MSSSKCAEKYAGSLEVDIAICGCSASACHNVVEPDLPAPAMMNVGRVISFDSADRERRTRPRRWLLSPNLQTPRHDSLPARHSRFAAGPISELAYRSDQLLTRPDHHRRTSPVGDPTGL